MAPDDEALVSRAKRKSAARAAKDHPDFSEVDSESQVQWSLEKDDIEKDHCLESPLGRQGRLRKYIPSGPIQSIASLSGVHTDRLVK